MRWWLLAVVACSTPPASRPTEPARPPVAARRPHDVVSPHGTRSDPYYWLRDDQHTSPEVLGYLEAENAYARAMLAPSKRIEDTLFAEARARLDEESISVPVFEDGFYYYARYERGQQHPVHARKRSLDGAEEILLDGNALAAGKKFHAIGDYAVSRDGKLLAWTEDLVGKNQYALRVKDLASGKLLPDTAANLAPSVVWANDNKTLFVVGRDATTLREDRVIRHVLGGAFEVVYREEDASYYVDVGVTKSRRYITIALDATTLSETRLIDADKPASPPAVFWPRKDDHIYELDHLDDRFVVRTNDGAENFQLVAVAGGKQTTLVEHRDDTYLESFAVYRGAVAAAVRRDGLARLRVVPAKRPAFEVDATDPTYAMSLVDTPDPAHTRVRYAYDSLTSPHAIYEVDPATGTRTLLQRERAPTYDPASYTSEYLRAPAADGARVPISLVRRKDTPRDGSAPLLLLGYGAYGESLEPAFDRERTSLVDRGWVVAIAHVRGGGELGDAWYEGGRLLTKQNTFTDFIAVTEFLVAQRYAARDRVFAEGGSAGGLLVAVVANLKPELYRGLIAWVPFVDVVTTMLDPTIPLVTNEYDEWGDPRDKANYDYMLAYSPYDNVRAQAYPAIYVRTGLSDGLVPYHEPAKWVAKLRATATSGVVLFETDMNAGHTGVTGRYDSIREEARAYAFLLAQAGGAR
jgi:oligopeptidase B